MFVKSSESEQLNLFSCASPSFLGKALSGYANELGWRNLFRKNVTMNINEELFNVLYNSSTDAPNASIRIMLAMMILKEAQGLSNDKIFEKGRYNALTRSALGIMNWDDSCPTESTYYLFRRSIAKYALESKGDLMEQMFADLTTCQCVDFEVSGKRIRMDSKLLGSNIAWLSRYEIAHTTIRLAYKSIKGCSNINKDILKELDAVFEVEATIFQLGHHYPNDKSRYRGLIKHQMWANIRCAWVNSVRIAKFTVKMACTIVFCLAQIIETTVKRDYREIRKALACLFKDNNGNILECQFRFA